MERLSTIINKQEVLEEIRCNNGFVELSLANLKLSKTQFYHWLKSDKKFEEQYFLVLNELRQNQVIKRVFQIMKDDPSVTEKLINFLERKLQNRKS